VAADQVQEVVSIPDGKIADYIDGKFRNDTPEEYVRQNIEKRLVNELKYSRERIKVEYKIKIGSGRPRADIAIFPADCESYAQEDVSIIIECKRESIEPTHKKEGIDQLISYMSACPNCEWGMWTNGKFKQVLRKEISEDGKYEFIEFNDIPPADGSLDEIDSPKRDALRNAVEDNLLFVFRTCHNHIYANDGLQKQPAFFELLKLIFCKIEDERNIPHPLEFYVTSSERSNPDGQLTVRNRIAKIFDKVKQRHRGIFEPNDEIRLSSRSLAHIVGELQSYSLLNTHIDVKGKAYEELVGANLRGDRGEFFTPRNVMHMTVQMLAPKSDERVLDPACGTGGFLVIAMNDVLNGLTRQLESVFRKQQDEWSHDEYRIFQEKISEIASNNFFGFDINPDLVRATKMNMVMNNDGSGNVFRLNSLLPPHEWPQDFKREISERIGTSASSIRNSKSIGLFDVIATNPPFGSKIPIKDSAILEQYDLGHIWEKDADGRWSRTDRLQTSVPPEQLFLERCMQLLTEGGRMGIVVPDAILGSPGLGYIRQWLVQHARIIASVDMHVDTFQPRNGTQTSVLILQKKTSEEIEYEKKHGTMADYSIFMAMAERIGHDKRGNPIFRRDRYGNEILVPEEDNVLAIGGMADGTRTVSSLSKSRVRDDQTPLVSEIFESWKQEEGIGW